MNLDTTASAIAQRIDLRDRLAEQMAAFEASHGTVTPSPIRKGDPPGREFRISNPDKPRAAKKAAPARKPKAVKAAQPEPVKSLARLGTWQARQRAVLAEAWP